MSQQKLTQWFPISTPPVRKGVYQVSCNDKDQSGQFYSHWNGIWFTWFERSPESANYHKSERLKKSECHVKSWRGIAK